jgi:hypothetical protein
MLGVPLPTVTEILQRRIEENRRKVDGLLAILAAAELWPSTPADATEVLVYKSPTCSCCNKWIAYLEDNGFRVKTENVADPSQIKAYHGVTPRLASCHTALVEGYVVEGHVPAGDIRRLLAERPKVKGLAVPGMPAGAPGMEGPRKSPTTRSASTVRAVRPSSRGIDVRRPNTWPP